MNFSEYNFMMSKALDYANEGFRRDEVPVGAIITDKNGLVIAEAFNTKEKEQQCCHHAEILAIEKASKFLGTWRLNDCKIFVTLEPCIMCMGALAHARIDTVVFGAYDPRGGALSLGYKINNDSRLNHKFKVYGGFRHLECSKLISNFFKQKRRRYRS